MSRRTFDLAGRVAIITGAAGGLGAALCRRILAEGGRVGALDVDASGLERLQGSLGAGLEIAACDLTDEDAVRRACGELRRRLGAPSVVIANAGITHLRNFAAGESAAVRRVMAVNFFGAVHVVDACFDDLVAEGGLAVAISSVAGYAPLVGRTAYSASKHAMHGFFDTLRCELRGTGAGVLVVCPSYIATGIRRDYEDPPTDRHGKDDPDDGADDSADDGADDSADDSADDEDARGRVVGREDSPEDVAEQVVRAILERRRFLTTGRVGAAAYWLRRFAPRLYESLMLRKIRQETSP